jgi:hypothetical protein
MTILERTGGHYSVTASAVISNAQSPSSEADSLSGGQEISNLLWNPNVHYCAHSSLQLGEISTSQPYSLLPRYNLYNHP